MSARQAAKMRGDERAMEEEAERTNPIGRAPLSGMGATPSMGLSQFRGGGKGEAHALGQTLRKYLHELHGGKYADDFCGGMSAGVASNSDTGSYEGQGREREDAAMAGLYYPESSHRQFLEGGAKIQHMMPDGTMMDGARHVGAGRKKRAPAGANDGRRKRAEVVKQVMAEKGMKMIEASKYVKEHGLYKGGMAY